MATQEFKFAPTEEFRWEKEDDDGNKHLMGVYVPGNTYNCTAHPKHDTLREKCKEWEADGKIVKYPLPPGKKFVTGDPK